MKDKYVRVLRVIAWLVCIGLIARWIGHGVYDASGSPYLAVPAAVVFALAALFAGPPYLVRPPGSRKVRRLRVVPKDKRRWLTKIIPLRRVKVVMLKERFTLLRTGFLVVACLVLFGVAAIPFVHDKITASLPKDLSSVLAYNPPVTTRVFSGDGEEICTFTNENRVRVTLDQVPLHVRQAFIAAEDNSFYEHGGINPVSIVRAASVNYRTGMTKQGASTLTQQVVKQVLLKNSEKTYRRKIQEVVLAVDIEKQLSKDQILEIYLNHVFLGHDAYGVQAAAQTYFGKDVKDLTLAEASLLAGLPRAPSHDSPYAHFDRARARQTYVLEQMVLQGFVTKEQADKAAKDDLAIIGRSDALNHTAAPYFCDHVRRELKRMYGNDVLFDKGLTVYTTLDMRMQRAAESAIRRGLIDLERRIGFTGPEGHDAKYAGCHAAADAVSVIDGTIDMARVASVGANPTVCVQGNVFPLHSDDARRVNDWSRTAKAPLAVGDIMAVEVITVTTPAPYTGPAYLRPPASPPPGRYAISAKRTAGPGHPEALQAALVAVDPHTGELRAYVGGYDFVESQYDSVSMAHRQPGSSIKPYVYLTALMHGEKVDDMVNDHVVCYSTSSGTWCPQNYKGPYTSQQYYGNISLRMALALSLNSISVQLAAKVGVEEVIRTMRKLGITSPLQRILPLAIGAAELTPWEHTFAYTSIASGGKVLPRQPGSPDAGVFIRRILDAQGKEIFRLDPPPRDQWPQAVPAADAYAMTFLMKGVVEQGTGARVRELQRPAAAKTGTTNDFRDTWFMGFTTDLVVGTWVGRMTPQPIVKEATGGSVALPIWLAAVKAMHPDTPAREFPVPDDVVLTVDPYSGELIPYQRGLVPQRLLTNSKPTGNFSSPSPY